MDFSNTTTHYTAREHRPSYYHLYHRARTYGAPAIDAAYPTGSLSGTLIDVTRQPLHAEIDSGPQTVEDLVRNGYFAVPKREPETAVLVDRQDVAWLTLDDTVRQIRERTDIYNKNMLELAWAECYAFNELAREGWPASNESWSMYRRRLADLHTEQRSERVRLWGDLSRVRQLVPPSVQSYLGAVRKNQILGLNEGDAP